MQNKTLNSFRYAVPALIMAAICFVFPVDIHAVPASPDIQEIIQPDGSVLNVRVKGDEWNNWLETVDGYSIVQDEKGYWNYIDFYEGNDPVLSGIYAHESPPFGIEKHLKKSKDFIRRAPSAESSSSAPGFAPPAYPFTGPVLFILAQFDDISGAPTAETDFASAIANDISTYYSNASYGNVTLNPAVESSGTPNNGVIGWVNVGYDHPNTGGSIGTANQQLTKDAILQADPFIDFSAYDIDPPGGDGYVDAHELAIVVIAAGFERAYSTDEPNVWGHRWDLDAVTPPDVDGVTVGADNGGAGGYAQFGEIHEDHQATVGIMVHELGHLIFGLPDLYDTDDSSEGIGRWSLMASGSWNGVTTSGDTPAHPDAWSKYFLGWVTPTLVTTQLISEQIDAASTSVSGDVYQILSGTPTSGEYFLIENRQQTGFDAGLPGSGLAIWHIDGNTVTAQMPLNRVNRTECIEGQNCSGTGNHYGIALEQADAAWDLEIGNNRGNPTDLWYAGNKTTFCSSSSPTSRLWNFTPSGVNITNISTSQAQMTADFQTPVIAPPLDPSGLLAAAVSRSTIDLSWADIPFCEGWLEIERKTGTADYAVIASVVSGSTYSDTGLSASTEYYYQVRAFNSAGNSAYSNQASATTNAPPAAPAASSNGGGGGGGCFIATAAYGSYMSDEVMVLREFRDKYLLTNDYGKAFVKAYYKYSPPIADVIKENEFMKTVTRVFLTPVVMGIAYSYQSLTIFIALLFAAIALRVRRKKGLTV